MVDNKINILKYIVIAILLSIVIYLSYIVICKTFIYPIKYDKYVIIAAKENNIDPYLVFAIIKQESNFDKNACSNKKAKGLMQILDSTADEISKEISYINSDELDLFDAKTNIYIGVKYFRTLLDRYDGNIRLALCAYNAGLGNVDKWINSENIYLDTKINITNIPFKETQKYLVNILKYYDKYVSLYD